MDPLFEYFVLFEESLFIQQPTSSPPPPHSPSRPSNLSSLEIGDGRVFAQQVAEDADAGRLPLDAGDVAAKEREGRVESIQNTGKEYSDSQNVHSE